MLDEKDRLLIAALHSDARASLVGLARQLGLSRSATQARMKRLEATGVINGYTIWLGPHPVETPATRAVVGVKYQSGQGCENIVPRLRSIPDVELCQAVAGSIDLVLLIVCPTVERLSQVIERIARTRGVAETTSHVVLKTYLDHRGHTASRMGEPAAKT